MKKFIGIDFRSLAAFRIAFGLVLLGDLLFRAFYLTAHYTDYGVFPRSTVIGSLMYPFNFSVYFLNGSSPVVVVLFLIQAVAHFFYTIGFKTKWATLVSWVLLVSLHNRNPLVLQGGDELARSMLFWTLFLPMGEYFSVDRLLQSATREQKERTITSVASFALIFQVAMLYFFAGILKDGPEWTLDGSAIYYALSIDEFVKPFGLWQLQFPWALSWATMITRYFEIFFPLLFFAPIAPLRLIAFLGFFAFQLGLFFSLELGIFPYVNIVCLLPILPSVFWDKLELLSVNNGITPRFLDFLRERTLHCLGIFGVNLAADVNSANPKRIDVMGRPRWLQLGTSVLVGSFLSLVLFWNIHTVESWKISFPNNLYWLTEVTRLDQTWNLFAPYPIKEGGYFVVPGYLSDNREVDAYSGEMKPPVWAAPALISATFSSDRERSYLMNIWLEKYSQYRYYFAQYLCNRWNDSHDKSQRMNNLQIVFFARTTLPNYKKSEPEKVVLWEGNCREASNQ